MEESTTQPVAPSTSEAPVQPEQPEAVQTEAAEQTEITEQQPVTEEQPEEPVQPDNSEDFDYAAWLEKKGIDPSTEEGKAQIAKSWREMEKKMHQTTQQASELEKQVQATPTDTDDDRVQRLEMLYNATAWKQNNKITAEQDEQMGSYLAGNPDKLQLVKYGLLSFDDVLAMSGAAKIDTAAIKKQGGQEALQTLANKQRATAPTGSATTQAPKPAEDPIMSVLSAD